MTPIVEELSRELKGKIEVASVNVDKDQEKASKYGIFSIPTFVLEKDGEEIVRTTGARSKEALKEWMEKYL